MLDIIFTFIITFLVLSVCWYVPKAGGSGFAGVTRNESLVIAAISLLPTIIMIVVT